MLLNRPVVFLGGKGGVGKTTVAAAWAVRTADPERPTLLVSTDPAHSTSDILETRLGPEPASVLPGLEAVELDPAAEAERYVDGVRDRLADTVPPRLVDEVERQIDVARFSPGAEVAALFERFARILEGARDRWPRVVFDTAPTAQTLRLLGLPELMTAWMSGLVSRRRKVNATGRMWRRVAGAAAGSGSESHEDPVLQALEDRRDRFLRARAILTDPARTGFVFVLTPERLPLNETVRAVRTLEKYHVPVAGVVVNQIIPLAATGSFAARRREGQAAVLTDAGRELPDLPRIDLPLLEEEPVGLEALRRLGERLTLEGR
jgi:arsenite-transporting ATPase